MSRPQLKRDPLDSGAMTFLAIVLASLGFLLFIGSFGLERPTSALVRAWGAAVGAIGLLALDIWALRTDIDNLEHGLRLGRALVPAVIALAALAWAMIRTIRWTRMKRTTRGTARAAV